MINFELLDPNKITKDGKYCDMSIPIITKLSDEEVKMAREYFHDNTIACERKLPGKTSSEQVKQVKNNQGLVNHAKPSPSQVNRPQPSQGRKTQGKIVKTKNYKLTKNGYSKKNVKTKGEVNKGHKGMVKVVVCGLTIFLSIEAFVTFQRNKVAAKPELPIAQEINIEINKPLAAAYVPETQSPLDELKQETCELIRKYCDIYSVDYRQVCNVFEKLTDNFTSADFVNELYIPGIHCKRREVRASSLEELVLYVVRNIKQAPNEFGLSSENLNVYSEADYEGNYEKRIAHYADLLGVDRCLAYAIVRTETGFNSNLFRNSNNPAGLRLNGDWWKFSTKDEGFIELCLELKKYELMGAVTIEEIGAIHAPVEDGNSNWVSNVTQIYEQAKEHEEELFGINVSNGLSK